MDGTHVTPTSSSSALLGAFDASIPTLHHASFFGKSPADSQRLTFLAAQLKHLQCLGGLNNVWGLA